MYIKNVLDLDWPLTYVRERLGSGSGQLGGYS